jgi:tetratricopeptide (TPR) repeat protein
MDAAAQLGIDYRFLGRLDKSLEYFDRAIRMSPSDPSLAYWYDSKAWANFGLKNYDQAIEAARRSIVINPKSDPFAHVVLIATLALAGHDAEAREAATLPHAAFHRAVQDDRRVEGLPDVQGPQSGRRSTLPRDERTVVRRPAQGGDAGGVSQRHSSATTSSARP